MTRFTNKSPGALTMEQAIARHKKSIAEDRRRLRQAQELAAQGRGSDTEIAHVARGELVVPKALQNPYVLQALRSAAAAYNIPLEMLSVGNALNRINPNTGAPEFGVMDWISGLFENKPANNSTAIVLPNNDINSDNASVSEASLGFDPNGPGKWGMALRHPLDAFAANRAGKQAAAEEQQMYLNNSNNDERDGWRHGRWSQLMAQSIGPERAKEFSDAYERSHPNPRPELLQDLYNNQVGRSLANDSSPELALQNAVRYGYIRKRPF